MCSLTKLFLCLFPLIALFGSSPSSLGTSSVPITSEGELTFYLDTAGFKAGEDRTYQEFYYQIPVGQFLYVSLDSIYRARFRIAVLLSDTVGHRIIADEWEDSVFATSLEDIEGRFLPGQFPLMLNPGLYLLSFEITDLNANRTGQAEALIPVISYTGDSLMISDVQCASTIEPDTTQSPFTKNTYRVVPNPSRSYGKELPFLYFYFEVYNVSGNMCHVNYSFEDERNNVVRTFPGKSKKVLSPMSVEVGGANLLTLPGGQYTLLVSVRDALSGVEVTQEQAFHVMTIVERSEVEEKISTMNSAGLENHIGQIRYFLTDADIEVLTDLDSAGKMHFLLRFWNDNDPTPETPRNEFWEEFTRRIEYTTLHLSSGFTEGWKTDRGRILIKFGIPDEIDRHPAEVNSKPYEVWFYHQERGIQFIFADLDGFGDYRLIYSNEETELSDPNWEQLIRRED